MNAQGSWWIPVVMTFAGVLITLLVNVWIDQRKGGRETAARLSGYARESAFRWTERKLDLYSGHLSTCHSLADLAVWPRERDGTAPDPEPLAASIARSAAELVYLAPRPVQRPTEETVSAARALSELIMEIRRNTTPGHGGTVEVAVRTRLSESRERFAAAVTEFVTVTRADIDIETTDSHTRESSPGVHP